MFKYFFRNRKQCTSQDRKSLIDCHQSSIAVDEQAISHKVSNISTLEWTILLEKNRAFKKHLEASGSIELSKKVDKQINQVINNNLSRMIDECCRPSVIARSLEVIFPDAQSMDELPNEIFDNLPVKQAQAIKEELQSLFAVRCLTLSDSAPIVERLRAHR